MLFPHSPMGRGLVPLVTNKARRIWGWQRTQGQGDSSGPKGRTPRRATRLGKANSSPPNFHMGHQAAALTQLTLFLTANLKSKIRTLMTLWSPPARCNSPTQFIFLPIAKFPKLLSFLWPQLLPTLKTSVITWQDTYLLSPLDSAKRAKIRKYLSNAWNKGNFSNQEASAVGIIHMDISKKHLNQPLLVFLEKYPKSQAGKFSESRLCGLPTGSQGTEILSSFFLVPLIAKMLFIRLC